eukprot:CCRYP_007683-RA/>CCRYP_007683-RA protein AED:0.55 eAED:1.00 QI:0/0/0/1/0/0/2/0/99
MAEEICLHLRIGKHSPSGSFLHISIVCSGRSSLVDVAHRTLSTLFESSQTPQQQQTMVLKVISEMKKVSLHSTTSKTAEWTILRIDPWKSHQCTQIDSY